jgi:hypothetical protein
MKKITAIKIGLIVSVIGFGAAALAQGHTLHAWQKLTEQAGVNGQVVCTWVCRSIGQGIGGEHHTTTSGYGSCPSPF